MQGQAWLDSLVGTTQSVLVELTGKKGHAENFAALSFPAATSGAIIPLHITGREGATLTGTPL